MEIKSLRNRAEFLRQTNDPNQMYFHQQSNIRAHFTTSHLQGQRSHQITQDDCTSCCALVFVLLFLFFIILACLCCLANFCKRNKNVTLFALKAHKFVYIESS